MGLDFSVLVHLYQPPALLFQDPRYIRTLDINEERVEARNLGGARVNARHRCTGSDLWYRYRSIVDVDLVGQADPPDTESKTKDIQCRPDD